MIENMQRWLKSIPEGWENIKFETMQQGDIQNNLQKPGESINKEDPVLEENYYDSDSNLSGQLSY